MPSYDDLVGAVKSIVAAGHINLVETLAARIAERCLADKRIVSVLVRVEKLERGPEAVGVEIVRARNAVSAAARPTVVKLGGSLSESGRIDTISEDDRARARCLRHRPRRRRLRRCGARRAGRAQVFRGVSPIAWPCSPCTRRV